MRPDRLLEPEQLRRHEPFVRELARLLVLDGHAAEDLAQQTWVAALTAAPGEVRSPRAWLAGVLQKLAGKHARRERVRRVTADRLRTTAASEPNAGHAASAAEVVEREHARAAVVRAVMALPEDYRSVVLLRWFDGMPPRDVAQRLGVPVETVRTRCRRALERLRAQLDRDVRGGREAWATMLLPLATPERGVAAGFVGVPVGVITAGGLCMTTKGKLLGAVALLAIAVLAWRLVPAGGAPLPADRAETRDAPIATATVDAGIDDRGIEAAGIEREHATPRGTHEPAAAAAPSTATGSIEVRTVWHDGTPAPGVLVVVMGRPGRRPLQTDEHGVVVCSGLAPRTYMVNIDRGHMVPEQPRIEVVAGAQTECVLTVPEGLTVAGVVVDANGSPIADAAIRVGAMVAGCFDATRTGPDGTFVARDLATRCRVGAAASQFAPSPMFHLTGSAGATQQLRIVLHGVPAQLRGSVVDRDGQPVAGALVAIEHQGIWRPTGSGPDTTTPETGPVWSDQDGRFTASPLASGPYRVRILSDEHATWREAVSVEAGETLDVHAVLLRGASLTGVVRTADGTPIAGASIRIESEREIVNGSYTDAEGRYRITSVAPGKFLVRARPTLQSQLTTSQQMTFADGVPYTWHVVLPNMQDLRGRVLAHDGAPAAKRLVVAGHTRESGLEWSAQTDADGRFRLRGCRTGVPMFVRVKDGRFAQVVLDDVVPGNDELVVRLPPPGRVFVRGVVVDGDGRPLPGTEVWLRADPDTAHVVNDVGTGAFEFGPLPAGRYSLALEPPGHAPITLPARELRAGETWHAGTITARPGGRLEVTFTGAVAEPSTTDLRLSDDAGAHVGFAVLDGEHARSPVLAPGTYRLHVDSPEVAYEMLPFTIVAGRDTRLDVPTRPGTPVVCTIDWPRSGPTPTRVRLDIDDASGAPVARLRAYVTDGACTKSARLAPGRYRVRAHTEGLAGGDLEADRTLVVGDTATDLDLTLERAR